jgi:hypothetical protein
MLSSIILSLAMSMSPATAIETNNLQAEEANHKRGTLRINHKRGTLRINHKRGTLRINHKRGTLRI